MLGFYACEKPQGSTEFNSLIVVDGWIENDAFAKVLLTRNTPYFSIVDSSSYLDLVETFASVSITDGVDTEFLTLTRDKSLFPWHVYKTTSMKGEVGKTYTLKVELHDTVLLARTTINSPPVIDSVWFEPFEENDTLGNLKMQFTDNPDTKDYYRILIKTKKDPKFYPVAASTIDDRTLSKPTNIWPLVKGKLSQFEKIEDLYFAFDEEVTIKFCKIDTASFNFWSTFQLESFNAVNPFATSTLPLEGNVSGEGLGIWSGLGVSYYTIKIEP